MENVCGMRAASIQTMREKSVSPNVPSGVFPTTSPDAITESTPGDPNSVPEVAGVPCTARNTGECIGLQEESRNATLHAAVTQSRLGLQLSHACKI